METDPQTISAYLVYLSQHAPVEEQGQHNDLALVREGIAWGTRGMSQDSGRQGTCCTTRMSFGEHVTLITACLCLCVWV